MKYLKKFNEEVNFDNKLYVRIDWEEDYDGQYKDENFTTRDLKTIEKVFTDYHVLDRWVWIGNPKNMKSNMSLRDSSIQEDKDETITHGYTIGYGTEIAIQKCEGEIFMVTFGEQMFKSDDGIHPKWEPFSWDHGGMEDDDLYFLCDGLEGLTAWYNDRYRL